MVEDQSFVCVKFLRLEGLEGCGEEGENKPHDERRELVNEGVGLKDEEKSVCGLRGKNIKWYFRSNWGLYRVKRRWEMMK